MTGTANPVRTTSSKNSWVDALVAEDHWSSGERVTTISVHIAGAGQVAMDHVTVDALTPAPEEREAILKAMDAIEAVCGIDFRLVNQQAAADIVWASVGADDAPGTLGWTYLPGDLHNPVDGDAQSLIAINRDAYGPKPGTDGSLGKGSFDWCTFVHELGHAVGLKHPHDTEGGGPTFPDVESAFGDYGAHDMNQGIWTMMSYNDGWATGPLGLPPGPSWGYQAGPMAFDIAALQHMYGANADTRTGNDSYALPKFNGLGTYLSCLWDAGGTDRIVGGNGSNIIDLRAATLGNGPGAAGYVSQAAGVHGGFTIARGTVIENALGGAGSDLIRGNSARNTLEGGGGQDSLSGAAGDDVLKGGAGEDKLLGGSGDDRLLGGTAADLLNGGAGHDRFEFLGKGDSPQASCDRITGFERGEDWIVLSAIDANGAAAGNGVFRLDTGGAFDTGEVRQDLTGRDLLLELNLDADAVAEMAIRLQDVGARLSDADIVL